MEPVSPPGDRPDAGPSDTLDLVEFLAKTAGIEEADLLAALELPRFRAAVAAFRLALAPLGYAVFFAWPEFAAKEPAPTLERVARLICHAARRAGLDPADPRFVSLGEEAARSAYPGLFEGEHPSQAVAAHNRRMREMGHFAEGQPWRLRVWGTENIDQLNAYAAYWLKRSMPSLDMLLSDRRFLAALDAYRQGILSYNGLLENLYGDDRGHELFPGLYREAQPFALRQLSEAADRGEIRIPQGLQEEHPDLYEYYIPEFHGHRR